MKLLRWWLPRSLAGRVFGLYAIALGLFVAGGLWLFFRYEVLVDIEDKQLRGESLVGVIMPTIADSAVIGDYDTIRHTLERVLLYSDFAHATFIDITGGTIKAVRSDALDARAPAALRSYIDSALYNVNRPIVVGGRDYGVLRVSFAAEHIAAELWYEALAALALAALALGGGLVAFRMALKGWLGNLEHIESFEADMRLGVMKSRAGLAKDAPIELQRTFEVINRAAANMQMQREQAAVTLDAIADSVFTLDAQGCVVLANPAACKALALAESNVLGRAAHELLPGIFAGQASYAPWRGRRGEVMAADGGQRVMDSTLSSITGPDGALYGHVLACRDVSEQHALDLRLQEQLRSRQAALTALRGVLEGLMTQPHVREHASGEDIEAISRMISGLVQRLQERGEQLKAIFTLSPDGFVSFDRDRRINFVSPAFVRLTGLDAEQVLGQDEACITALLAQRCPAGAQAVPDFDTLRRAEAESLDGGRRRLLLDLERPTRRTLEVTLRSGNGSIAQVLHLRDVTHETEVDQMKSEFLSTAAHELRTPMANIFGFVELMMRRPLSPARQQDVLQTLHRQAGLMISIVNELLDLARIEARRGKDFDIERLDLCELARTVIHDFQPPQQRAAPVLDLPALPLPVRVDRGKLSQALGNVLSNAYKYSPQGGDVHVSVRCEPAGVAGAAEQRVGLVVGDQGMGMTAEQLARVSERFYRADASGNIPGTGLGMSIVKEIVELLGGSLELQSQPGQGTQVTLWLPLPQTGTPDAQEAAAVQSVAAGAPAAVPADEGAVVMLPRVNARSEREPSPA
ncbi:PAS domain-containing sensor histidine kinase [Azohydromonas lata]|uniref:PAS domain-containing sensor histidine kinase n=1 Tax=Azohydromonas lata TaxID=45677 RepID=UPI000A03DEAB|nr:ATP-binding protein [Azohydromonas lata]